MFYSGNVRSASSILSEQNKNVSDQAKFNNLVKMTELTYELKDALQNNDLTSFGSILHKGWMLKRELANGITNPLIDKYYDIAMENGALGGKLLGAGGGGFLLMYVPKERQDKLRNALSDLSLMDFSFDHDGSKIIFVGDKTW